MLRLTAGQNILSVFSSPYLELIRLLHEASEIEHALMLQYLYASFSIKPKYMEIAGSAFGQASLIRIAVEEMQHLGIVSKFLSELGGAPHLLSQDFPYFQDIYPFPLNLEPLSRNTVAKYTYVEASANIINDPHPEDDEFVLELLSVIGPGTRPNQLGSLYSRILEIITTPADLIASAPKFVSSLDLVSTKKNIERIKSEGENEHFSFFKSIFLGNHLVFDGITDVWSLYPLDPNYPSIDIRTNPSAYRGSHNQISDPDALQVAYLSNLHYWTILLLLDLYYRYGLSRMYTLAVRHMQSAVLPLGKHLVTMAKIGLPFDASPIGYNAGKSVEFEQELINSILAEAEQLAKAIGAKNIDDFDESLYLPITK